ncbi:DNA replication/repair protein RecF [Ruegeria pomeroyi]|uniref:DNA replication and repair protein RecF n=2 Tax=Ruegeria pomeroyi TaxID=89184 RepID=Q5LWV2_RUEPO|nr:DNA replication/repair protein RecF [Ruegeria pomeroyi]HCE70448.1 DNA replication and repair protein RecF [Ruegeria sp.]AAV93479.1 DNA replication and repair protein RecF [Ruegeria pomeroyi DSS-3]NVK96543.1 DNA replication/repair protein RecF [Ruegeria pomeroyi]NVL01568.1 DNA replication/repair protein RecF [Ruegeria pomeroyi]QWV10772.1 DNA replication/repair protein RecF [Ruegeria pomeroyi]
MALALTAITISHFRSHRLLRLSLDERPVAIHGPNGAGKTNILEAVSMFSPGRGMRRASAAEMTRRPEVLGWKLSAELVAGHQRHEIETWSEGGAARQVRIDDKAASQVALGRLVRMVWLVPSMDRLWIEGPEGRRRFLDRMTMSFEPDHAEAVLVYEKAMRERNRLLREQVRDAHWYLALETQMAAAGHRIHAARQSTLTALAAAQTQAETSFPTAELELIQTEGALPESEGDLREALAESRFRDLAAGRTLVGPHRSDLYGVYAAKGVPASDCSTGEQKALLVSLILANARALARQVGAPPVLLLDEIAAHLDAGRRAALYDEICALGAQAWMTGTGPELFSELGARAQTIALCERDGQSEVVET